MLWAVLKLYFALGRNNNIKEFFSQKMMILHLATSLVYLLSLGFMYCFNSRWDHPDLETENKVFTSFTVAVILLFFVQLVLIYIFYELGRAPKENS